MDPIEPTLEDSIAEVLRQVPAPIREFLTGPERDKTLRAFTAKYSLHIDQADVFERQFISMLLGLVAPEAFVAALQESGIAADVVTALAKDLNDTVFVPLRQKIRAQGGDEEVAPEKTPTTSMLGTIQHPPLPNAPTMSTPMADKTLNRLAPATPTPVAAPMPLRPAVPAPQPPRPTTPAPQAVRPTPIGLGAALRSAGVPLLEDHEEPHIEFKKVTPSLPVPPIRPATPASMPVPVPRPAMPSMPPASTAPLAKYTVDPYREVPEAHEK